MTMSWNGILSREIFAEFKGRCMIVAGGAGGIGAALCDGLHWLGADVAILDSNSEATGTLADELASRGQGQEARPLPVTADLTQGAERVRAIKEIVARLGQPYGFISTIGLDVRIELDALTQDELRRQYEVNFVAPVFTAREIVTPMRAGGGGAICVFTSRHGGDLTKPEALAYGTSKAALNGAVKRLSIHAAEGNTPENTIRVFGFCPGWVLTTAQRGRFDSEFAAAAARQAVPTGMMPEDVVFPVVAAMSRHFRYLAGSTLRYDAGPACGD